MNTAKEKRTALVSGGSRGLGRAMALELAGAGAHVAVNYFNRRDAAEQTCATIRQSGGHARAFPADVRDESEVARLVQEVNGAFGAVDILVVNATGSQPFSRLRSRRGIARGDGQRRPEARGEDSRETLGQHVWRLAGLHPGSHQASRHRRLSLPRP